MSKQFYFKQFSLAQLHSLIGKFLKFKVIQFSQTVLILTIHFSITILLNVQTVLFQEVQFSVSTHFSSI